MAGEVIVRVSQAADQLILDNEAALLRLLAAKSKDEEAKDHAYADYYQRRKELYEYLEALEILSEVERSEYKRFKKEGM